MSDSEYHMFIVTLDNGYRLRVYCAENNISTEADKLAQFHSAYEGVSAKVASIRREEQEETKPEIFEQKKKKGSLANRLQFLEKKVALIEHVTATNSETLIAIHQDLERLVEFINEQK